MIARQEKNGEHHCVQGLYTHLEDTNKKLASATASWWGGYAWKQKAVKVRLARNIKE